jgi:hypothetical protein
MQEVHEAIKVLNGMMGKGSTDWQDRADNLNAETKLVENAL